MTQVTTASREYRFEFAEDIPSEVYPFAPGVERTPELDQIALNYLNARLALYAAVQPARMLPDVSLDYSGSVVVSETTSESARLHPVDVWGG